MMIRRTMSMVLGVIVAVAAAGLAPTVAAADASQRCYGVTGGGTTWFDGAGFSGIVELRVGGQVQLVDVYAVPKISPDGAVTGTMHLFEFDQGAIATDDELLAPLQLQPGEQQLWTALTIVDGGSGAMRLLPTGTIDIFGGTASWQINGHVCFDGIDTT
jgi:hypothetical protein